MRHPPFVFVLVASLYGCAGPAPYTTTRFDAYGDIDQVRTTGPIVKAPQDVKVFYGTSPAGFSLRDNELKIEPGFGHRILGTVKIVDTDGTCEASDFAEWRNNGADLLPGTPFTKQKVIADLRQKAHEAGGNALIYVVSEVGDDSSGEQACAAVEHGRALGSGWVVVLGKAPPPGGMTSSTTPR